MNHREYFKKELIQQLEQRGYRVSEAYCIKNNGERDGIVFHNKSTFSPVFYLEELYDGYSRGIPVSRLTEKIIADLSVSDETEEKLQKIPVMEGLCDYEKIRANVKICMINKRTNESLLATTPHRDYGDFAAIVYWMEKTDMDIRMRILINDEVLGKMNADFSNIFKDAYINMMGEFEIKSMEERLYEQMKQQLSEEEMGAVPAERYIQRMCQGMNSYLLTHKSGVFGASALCYQRELDRAATILGGDYIMIPASIHELLFLPFTPNVPLEELRELIRQMHEEYTDQEDRLSSQTYIYLADENRLVSDREYVQEIQENRMNEQYQRITYVEREEWRDTGCHM